MDVIAIVTDYLEKNGFDGLYHDGDCACENKVNVSVIKSILIIVVSLI
jgi:hypothetical protein|tara:strand:+ start:641 stop:784 length:144 start_codon:yes stop_codon:yes gene_type:complete